MENSFYNGLRAFFVAKGMTQAMIARDLGTSQAYVGRLFSGASNFGHKTAARFEELYGLNSAWLITGRGPMLRDGENPPTHAAQIGSVETSGDNSPAVGVNSGTVAVHNSTEVSSLQLSEIKELLRRVEERLASIEEKEKKEKEWLQGVINSLLANKARE